MTGIVFARILERTKVANAQLDLTRIQEGLVMYNTRENKYPLDIETLVVHWRVIDLTLFRLKVEN